MSSSGEGPSELPLPNAVSLPFQATIAELWSARTQQHFDDSYAGVSMLQFPEDLRVFEHLLWLSRPNTVIEIGVQSGGSTLWFRDRLKALEHYGLPGEPRVIGVDLDISPAVESLTRADPAFADSITLIEGDVLDPALSDRVAGHLMSDARCMVVEDSGHTYETTRAALDGFARFVPPGGFLIVEDGCVDIEAMRVDDGWPRGVLPAVTDWLATPAGSEFLVRRELEIYGISCHPHGFLQRSES